MVPKLISEHGVWLSALLRGLTRSEADAEDAYQEVWLRLIKRGGLPEGASVRAYLAQTARSVVVDRFRRDPADGVELSEELVDGAMRPDERVESLSVRERLRGAVRALPENWRSVVLLRIEAELTFEEIAAELKLPLGTVLTWMRKATEELKRKMGGVNG